MLNVRVVKIGGNELDRPEWLAACARAIAAAGPVVVVHGGGRAVSALSQRLDLPVQKRGGKRVTSREVAEVVEMVLAGPVNRAVVAALRSAGLDAVGLSGVDGALLTAEPLDDSDAELGHVGRITEVRAALLHSLLLAGLTPVIAPMAPDVAGDLPFNVNADDAAAAVARAMGAYKIVFLTDVTGWLSDASDPESVISQATAHEVEAALAGVAGGMRPKLQAALDAIHGGVSSAHIIDGRIPHSLLLELFTDAGIGTKIGAAS